MEDYAFMIRGLLALHRVEPDDAQKANWLSAARTLQAKADQLFWDSETGGYFFTTPQADLIVRGKDLGDNATPGGNSVMAHNLIELATATGDPAYRTRAEELLRVFSGAVSLSPQSSDTGTCLMPAEWSDEVRVRVNGRSELESGSQGRR